MSENVGIAFALVIGAGAATALGAAVVFVPSLVKFANRKTLAAGLGLSSGVMTYVSFVEIFQKAFDSFMEQGHPEDKAYLYATACFFGGVVGMVLLNLIVTWLLGGHHHHHHHDHTTMGVTNSAEDESDEDDDPKDNVAHPGCPCVGQLEDYQTMVAEIKNHETNKGHDQRCCGDDGPRCDEHESRGDQKKGEECEPIEDAEDKRREDNPKGGEEQGQAKSGENSKLMRMSVNTALAIALHNFPEGLATFVAALDDPGVGAVLAAAIALHNIPEGLCVAMPIYYATGNRWKAFAWGCLSGLSEPIAALLGWAILANVFSHTLYGVLFGLVAGMMVIISVRELLPTAHRYDPEDKVVTYSFMFGMFIMALSLVLFVL